MHPQPDPLPTDIEARVRESFARQGLMAHLGAVMTELDPGRAVIRLPFRDALTQQHGYFHAGGTSAIADSAGGYAAFTRFPEGSSVLTVEYKINLLAPAEGAALEAVGQVIRHGRTLTICGLEVFACTEDARKLIAVGQQTLICLHGKPDTG
ncbi:thioesterase family protein [Hyphomonas neptunium ATCC 15444]|uniref:Medium/long-chain acyl-CoA thioesterase YigI n=2 Tax=Hyphomonas TaxID=85 RepID=Q0C266_HYPNA|nr:PaaI family thioesterase [Hyphomonas hirschiana]ABI77293.1 thioesterase family protein [Hyphomonas neptunium ATCC 15444]KCZ93111.1 thioesterase family protein [Hyphomonas hirschiana VP5]